MWNLAVVYALSEKCDEYRHKNYRTKDRFSNIPKELGANSQ